MSFFRTTVYLCLALILFNLSVSFIASLDVFPIEFASGAEEELGDPDVDMMFTYVFSFSLGAGITIIICILMRSVVPLGLYIFSVVYWASWISAQSILSTGGYIPVEFIVLGTAGVAFLFVATIIGILTGSG